MSRIYLGTSGWVYPSWRKVFYPEKLPLAEELHYLSSQLGSVEVNGSFYRLQTPASYQRWYEQAPSDFRFSVKGSRFITHMKKLNDIEVPLANFYASGVLALREKLGPFLWQFPANWKFDPQKFKSFLELLPFDTFKAAKLACRHDARLKGRAFFDVRDNRPIRHGVEVRHPSFFSKEFLELLRAYGVALVFADTATKWPYLEDLTADFVYIRLHGVQELYVSGYDEGSLQWWENRIRAWQKGEECPDPRCLLPPFLSENERDVYVYFDNDAKVHAPFDALSLQRMLISRQESRSA